MCVRARACVQARPARIILRQPSAHLPENGIVSLGCELRGVHLRWRCHPKACGQLSSIVRVKLPRRDATGQPDIIARGAGGTPRGGRW